MMTTPIVLSIDLEDHTRLYGPGARYVANTVRILDFLDGAGVKATFFTVGRIGRACPELVREVVGRGHDLACHSLDHQTLDQESPESFRAGTAEAKAILEDVAGCAVTGYRAPVFSLTKRTAWAADILHELGFTYSSSVMPAPNPLHGFPDAPRRPFRWPCGLLEIPCPVADVAGLSVPFLGGIYFRYLPTWAITRLQRRVDAAEVLWTYLHPYDFDAAEPFTPVSGASRLTSLLLWMKRGATYDKLGWLLAGRASTTFAELVAALSAPLEPPGLSPTSPPGWPAPYNP